jgi:EAL domain-containing protein (putative c-di-GMP-specific phosphodiesterase class I)
MLMHDLELSIRKPSQLREADLGVAINDFGTGYSSLLPTSPGKTTGRYAENRQVVHSKHRGHPNVATLVATVVSLARAFNTKTVAEGVETAEQLQKLRYMKCDQAKGYLISRPVPAADVPTIIGRLERAQFTTIHAFSNLIDLTR